jgi:two-component system, OmpR family, sensor histidine kinase VanS
MSTRLPIRVRLTAAFGLTFAAVVAALLAALYLYLSAAATAPAVAPVPAIGAATPAAGRPDPVGDLLPASAVALLVGAVAAVAAGWLVAGRMLAPIRRVTTTAARIAAGDLHRRVALAGPDDELKKLADTFDGMLERLQAAFDTERRFTANASHELLTPLATSRTMLEVAAADPVGSDHGPLLSRLLVLNTRSEHLVDALLTLATAEHGTLVPEPTDLAAVTGAALDEVRAEAAARTVAVAADLRPAPVAGDPALLTRLAANLLRNAVRHNHARGQVTVTVRPAGGGARLTVTNTGPAVPPARVDDLFEPFTRAAGRTRAAGHGLGLAIARAITTAHRGSVSATANPAGGLSVTVMLPAGSPRPGRSGSSGDRPAGVLR